MDTITNIKINYMLLEQILRVTGTYKNICDEYGFLDEVFKQAKSGRFNSLFRDEEARNAVFEFIEEKTGVPIEYWSGKERIKLDVVLDIGENKNLHYDNETIDTIDLSNDEKCINKEIYINEETGEEENPVGHAYHGLLYQELLKNPLHLDFDKIFGRVTEDKGSSEAEVEEAIKTIESLYSLKGLLTVILLNMADEIELIDKANVYKRTKWEPYINKSKEPTEHGITYSPKFVEIRNESVKTEEGFVQTIIRNIFDLGYVFTYRDTGGDKYNPEPKTNPIKMKEFKIIIPKQK